MTEKICNLCIAWCNLKKKIIVVAHNIVCGEGRPLFIGSLICCPKVKLSWQADLPFVTLGETDCHAGFRLPRFCFMKGEGGRQEHNLCLFTTFSRCAFQLHQILGVDSTLDPQTALWLVGQVHTVTQIQPQPAGICEKQHLGLVTKLRV